MRRAAARNPRLKFFHLFLATALAVVLLNFAIGGFAPYFMVLIPAFPFIVLSSLPISRKYLRDQKTQGILVAGIGAFVSVLPVTAIFAYDMVTGWKGGADIGLGLLFMFLPVYSVIFMTIGYLIGEMLAMIRHRDYKRWPEIFRTSFLFTGIGSCIYFLFKSHSAYSLWRYYKVNDPSAAELYGIDVWLYAIAAGAAFLIPLIWYLVSRKTGEHRRK